MAQAVVLLAYLHMGGAWDEFQWMTTLAKLFF